MRFNPIDYGFVLVRIRFIFNDVPSFGHCVKDGELVTLGSTLFGFDLFTDGFEFEAAMETGYGLVDFCLLGVERGGAIRA